MPNDPGEFAAAREAKNKAKKLLEGLPQVSGVGITQVDEHYAVKVNLEGEPEQSNAIPETIDGIPVVVHLAGRIRKLGSQG